jgi:hypothetical protein
LLEWLTELRKILPEAAGFTLKDTIEGEEEEVHRVKYGG